MKRKTVSLFVIIGFALSSILLPSVRAGSFNLAENELYYTPQVFFVSHLMTITITVNVDSGIVDVFYVDNDNYQKIKNWQTFSAIASIIGVNGFGYKQFNYYATALELCYLIIDNSDNYATPSSGPASGTFTLDATLVNNPPIAVMYIDKTEIAVGETLTADASSSYDPDTGDTVTDYYWKTSDGWTSGWITESMSMVTAEPSDAGKTYTVSVKVRDNHDAESLFVTKTFYVTELLPSPTLVSPSDGATITDSTPSFDWSSVSGADSYQIQVDDYSSFLTPIIDITTTSSGYAAPNSLEPGTYYWRVRTKQGTAWSDWSSTWTFTMATAESITISGYVYDKTTYEPISGAKVYMSNYGTAMIITKHDYTDSDGYYSISGIDTSEMWSFDVTKSGYVSHKETYLTFTTDTEKNVYLTPLSANMGTVRGYVYGQGEGLAGATVTFDGPDYYTTSTNAYGFYEIEVSAGDYIVTAGVTGYHSKTISVTVSTGGATQKNFYLEKSDTSSDASSTTNGNIDWGNVFITLLIVGFVIWVLWEIASAYGKKKNIE